jgi:hypothetical protein
MSAVRQSTARDDSDRHAKKMKPTRSWRWRGSWFIADETADQLGKRLMFWPRIASSEEVPKFDFGRCPAGRHVRFVQDGDATVVVATEKPSVPFSLQ